MAHIELSEVAGLEEAFKQLREELAPRQNEGWLSGAKAIGEYLGVPAETIHNWRQSGRLIGVVGQDNPPHGKLVASKAELDAWRRESACWISPNGGPL